MPATRRIGVPQSGYKIDRNITDSLPGWLQRLRPVDPSRVITAIRYRISGGFRHYEQFRFAEPYWPRADLLHFFNTVAEVQTPWITTFEQYLPQWGRVSEGRHADGLRFLLGRSCRKLLALSDAALRGAELDWAQRLPADAAQALHRKAEVLLPPQSLLCTLADKPVNALPLFAFVGRDFYRKGGLEMLEAFFRLWSRGKTRWRLSIAGSLDTFGDYASKTTAKDRERAVELLSAL